MATLTLSQALDRVQAREAQARARMVMATRVLAQQAALKATKRQLQAAGLKVNHFPMRELRARAETYLAAHREELIAEARAVVAQWEREGYFSRGRRSKLSTDAQGGKA
jgi:hypothetical protein